MAAKHARQSLTKKDFEVLAQFRYLLRHFIDFSEAAARRVGLTPQQHQALLAIHGFPGRSRVTVSELAERLRVRHHSAVGLVDRLVSRRLLFRRRDALDRRRVWISLRPEGRAVLKRLSFAHRDELRRLVPLLGPLLSRFGP